MKNQLIKIYTLPFVLLLSMITFGQANTVATGGDASGSGGSASYSVGQIDYSNVDAGAHNMNEGVQQPYEFYGVLSISEHNIVTQIYPNPTSGLIQIKTEEKGLTYQVHDAAGKVIQKGLLIELITTIDLSSYSSGAYFLEVNRALDNIQTIKIIKN